MSFLEKKAYAFRELRESKFGIFMNYFAAPITSCSVLGCRFAKGNFFSGVVCSRDRDFIMKDSAKQLGPILRSSCRVALAPLLYFTQSYYCRRCLVFLSNFQKVVELF